jgi:predicted flap endonuclease-1-like 5' DNA nuclease
MASISDIEGVGPAYAEKLEAAGVKTVEGLLETAGTKKGREELAASTGIAEANILKWVNHADLFRIKGVAGQFAELLEAAGVDSVPELAQRNAANLAAKMEEVNGAKNLANRTPSESEVEKWVAEAKTLDRAVHH